MTNEIEDLMSSDCIEENNEESEQGFYKYSSIENTYRQEYIDRTKAQGYKDIQYLITEKVHGSNTQVSFDGSNFVYGTRTHFLCDDEKCYNLQGIIEPLKEKISILFHELKTQFHSINKLIIFGEVCGGSYPHVDVEKNNKAIKVQKGVFYTPDNVWLIFDMCIVFNDGSREYLSQEITMYHCKQHCLPHVPILKVTNSLDEALAYPNDEPSVVYKTFNLPPIEDNIMEGVVIKPYKISPFIGQSRVIFKNKNEKFKEKAHARRKPLVQVELPEHLVSVVQQMSEYVTENRITNIISHYGEPAMSDLGAIIKEANLDVIKSFNDDTGLLNTLEKNEQKIVTRLVSKDIAQLVKEQVMSKIRGL